MIGKFLMAATAVLLCQSASPVAADDSPQAALERLGAIHGPAALALRARVGGEIARLQPEKPFTFVIIGVAWTGGIDGLRHLAQVPELRGVQFSHADVTDDWLRVLADRTDLKEVYLSSPELTDRGLAHLKKLENLEALSLVLTGITDDGLAALKNMTRLQWLSLQLTDISDEGMKHLEGLTDLRMLDLRYSEVSDAGLDHLRNATKMEDLRLSGHLLFSPGFEKLFHMERLRELRIGDMQLSDDEKEDMQRLLERTEGLRIVAGAAGETIYTRKGAKTTTRAERLAHGLRNLLRRQLAAGIMPKIDGTIDGQPVRLPKELHKEVTEAAVKELDECDEVEWFVAEEWKKARQKTHLRFEFAVEEEKTAPVQILLLLSDQRTPSEIWAHYHGLNLRLKNCGGTNSRQWKTWTQKTEPVL